MKKKMLITGCAGFIGRQAWDRFKDRYDLIGVDNLTRPGSEMPKGDVHGHDAGCGLFYHADVILHLAAQVSVTSSILNPRYDLYSNCEQTLALAEWAKLTGAKMIFASTNKVFGSLDDDRYPIPDNMPINPQTPYGISKAAGGLYVRDLLPDHGYVFHQSCIYGETQKGTVDQGWVGYLRRSIATGTPITCFGDGSQVRDLLHVSDLLDAYELAIDGTLKPGSYICGGGTDNSYPFDEVVILLGGWTKAYEAWRPHDQRCFISANEGLNDAGWHPKVAFTDWVAKVREGVLA